MYANLRGNTQRALFKTCSRQPSFIPRALLSYIFVNWRRLRSRVLPSRGLKVVLFTPRPPAVIKGCGNCLGISGGGSISLLNLSKPGYRMLAWRVDPEGKRWAQSRCCTQLQIKQRAYLLMSAGRPCWAFCAFFRTRCASLTPGVSPSLLLNQANKGINSLISGHTQT